MMIEDGPDRSNKSSGDVVYKWKTANTTLDTNEVVINLNSSMNSTNDSRSGVLELQKP